MPAMDVEQSQNHDPVPLVQMRGITKRYPGCVANNSIDLVLETGSIHALLGENGAGKSTLVKILYGLLAADEGTVSWQGKEVNIRSPGVARSLGIAMVFQHFSQFDSLNVLENIALGMDAEADGRLRDKIREVSAHYGLPLDPERSVYTLSVGERQRIEIVRCLLQEPKLLIMDEPTSVLTPQEVSGLFETLKALAAEGVTILYISHKLEEIRRLCTKATILRNGRMVAETDPKTETVASLAELMMGKHVPTLSQRSPRSEQPSLLSINSLSQEFPDHTRVALQRINLSVSAGEIVGIAGVAGNGQDELMQVIAGEVTGSKPSTIFLGDLALDSLNAGQRRRLGLCCVPEERLGHAAVPDLSLVENAFLTGHHRKKFRNLGLISYRRSRQFTEQIIEKFHVQCSGADAMASTLSGGNLQKFIVGREILQEPRVLVISQPTWGVDAGAANAIQEAIRQLAAQGAAVLLISQDIDELMVITDRIGALCAGRLSDFFPTDALSIQQLGVLMGGEALPAAFANSGGAVS